ncbi:hypothetical protein L226DRAFT_92116 [Lentinus tigrinus ALCF2SS1-7]|uniref:uncharacterized protein n=1 Tax=Lentinus tigrinus ALCF2SS1-7 TaxID=1328758 RepID=UPI0011660EE1|nr:hypothetical protein L226DRAFT_92116 [Lentinus tigrinus ALCF2SS1-7]
MLWATDLSVFACAMIAPCEQKVQRRAACLTGNGTSMCDAYLTGYLLSSRGSIIFTSRPVDQAVVLETRGTGAENSGRNWHHKRLWCLPCHCHRDPQCLSNDMPATHIHSFRIVRVARDNAGTSPPMRSADHDALLLLFPVTFSSNVTQYTSTENEAMIRRAPSAFQ